MSPAPPIRPRQWPDLAAAAVMIGACGVCCTGPLLALLGGISVTSLAGAVLVPALGVLAVITAAAAGWLLTRRRRARRRRAVVGVVDLGLPAAAAVPPSARTTAGVRR